MSANLPRGVPTGETAQLQWQSERAKERERRRLVTGYKQTDLQPLVRLRK